MSRAAYDDIADWYDEALRSGPLGRFQDLAISIILNLAGNVEDRRICDLACGQGILSRRLARSEEHTSELQSLRHLVCRLLLEKKKKTNYMVLLIKKKKTKIKKNK